MGVRGCGWGSREVVLVDWTWICACTGLVERCACDEDEEWDPEKGKGLEGARDCVEGLLKRNTKRKTLDAIAAMDWVRDAIDVPAGLKRGDKEVP